MASWLPLLSSPDSFDLIESDWMTFIRHKTESVLQLKENKLPIVNQQSVVYESECGLCDAGYSILSLYRGNCNKGLTNIEDQTLEDIHEYDMDKNL